MTTAEDYESIANEVYRVDPLKQNPPLRRGEAFYTDNDPAKQQWQVVKVSAASKDGFQAMAVVPVVGGVPDLSHVEVAYAGTNFEDPHDLAADLGVVVRAHSAQCEDALAFADQVEKEFPGATFSTVGHSLGGFLAMYAAAEKRWSGTAFNAPDAYQVMSPATKKWVDAQNTAGTNPLTDYVNEFDTVGNFLVNRSGAAVFVEDDPGRSIWDYHNIGKNAKGKPNAFRFDPAGGIIGAGVKQADYGVILYNAGQKSLAQGVWSGQKDSPYLKVLVAMEPAYALAEKIGSLAEPLNQIKKLNSGLTAEMQEVLDAAKQEYPYVHQFVTHTDVETCIAVHQLKVHQNIDENKVAEVNTLVDQQLTTVHALQKGIHNAIINTLTHDIHSAAAFNSH